MPDTLFDLNGKVALVTGTSRGLGQYFARALARAGADIAMTSRDKTSLSQFADEIHAIGRQTCSAALDVRDHGSIQAAIAAVEAHTSARSISWSTTLACNIRKPAFEVTWDDWNMVLDTKPARLVLCSASCSTRHGPARLRAHHQHRLSHQRLRLRRSCSIRSEPRRRTPNSP